MYEYAQIYNDANGAPEGDSLACEQYAALEQYPDNGVMVINNIMRFLCQRTFQSF